ncbi:MAG: hypothetical protein RI910_2669 [Verrucomicrobiota bacterium]
MPLTHLSGDVAGGFEALGDGELRERKRPLVVILDAEALLIAPRKDPGSGGHALRGAHVTTREAHALAGHRIEVRRPDVFVGALGAKIRPAMVVRVDEDDVRLLRGDGRERGEQEGEEVAKHAQGEVEVMRSRRNSRAPAFSPVGPPESPPSPNVSFSSAMQGATPRMAVSSTMASSCSPLKTMRT